MKTYLIRCTGSNLLKIGKSSDVDTRLKQLQIGSGSILELVHVFDIDIESKLHNSFSDKRKHGEWFDVNYLDVINFMNSCNSIKIMFELADEIKNYENIEINPRHSFILGNFKWIDSMRIGEKRLLPIDYEDYNLKDKIARYSLLSGKNFKIKGSYLIRKKSS